MPLMKIRKPHYFNRYTFAAIVVWAGVVFGLTSCGARNQDPHTQSEITYAPSAAAVNINTASFAELQKIPYVGEKLAAQIVEHRDCYGQFRKPEVLILIPGISDSRFRKIRDQIRVD